MRLQRALVFFVAFVILQAFPWFAWASDTAPEPTPEPPDMAALAQLMSPGAQLYMLKGCHACHGIQGEGIVPKHGPRLAGLPAAYLARQLTHFQNGMRGDSFADLYGRQMQLAVNSLSASHIQLISQHLANYRAGAPLEVQLDGDSAKGSQIYQSQCLSCHGEGGVGIPALEGTPLAGQIDVYLAQQLRNYQSGIRGSHPDDVFGRQMREGVAGLSNEQDIVDVSVYLASVGDVSKAAPPMTPEEVVASFYRRLDGRDKNAIYEILHPDVIFHFPDRQVVGPAGYWAYVSQVALLIPDYSHQLTGIAADDADQSLVHVRNISISGSLANGERLALPGTARYRVVDGRIVEAWVG